METKESSVQQNRERDGERKTEETKDIYIFHEGIYVSLLPETVKKTRQN